MSSRTSCMQSDTHTHTHKHRHKHGHTHTHTHTRDEECMVCMHVAASPRCNCMTMPSNGMFSIRGPQRFGAARGPHEIRTGTQRHTNIRITRTQTQTQTDTHTHTNTHSCSASKQPCQHAYANDGMHAQGTHHLERRCQCSALRAFSSDHLPRGQRNCCGCRRLPYVKPKSVDNWMPSE